jgi:hypothetical protein
MLAVGIVLVGALEYDYISMAIVGTIWLVLSHTLNLLRPRVLWQAISRFETGLPFVLSCAIACGIAGLGVGLLRDRPELGFAGSLVGIVIASLGILFFRPSME